MSEQKDYYWFIARNSGGQARLQHATERPGGRATLCKVWVGDWSRFHMNYIPGFACLKCAVKAGLVTQSRKVRTKRHLRSAS